MTTMTQADAATEKKVDKLVKLAKAAEQHEPGSPEAQNAADLVNRLMAEWGVEQARIDAAKAKGQTEPLVEGKTDVIKGSWAAPFEVLICGLAGAGQMRILERTHRYGPDKGGKTYTLLGFESDVEQALILFASLRIQAEHACKKAAKAGTIYRDWFSAGDKYKARREFMLAFVSAALAKINTARAEVLAEAKERDAEAMRNHEAAPEEGVRIGAEVALATKEERVDEFLAEKYPILGMGRARSIGRGTGTGYDAGREAGQRANVGTSKGITTGPGQLR